MRYPLIGMPPTMLLLVIMLFIVQAPAPAPATTQALAPVAVAADTRPNILLILTDDLDLRLGSLGVMPNLQALLAAQGTSFSQAFVPISLCCPSRASLLRGQYPHNHGVYTNGPATGGFQRFQELGLEEQTVATALQGAGYRAVLLGKHLNGYPDPAAERFIPPGWSEWYSPASDNAAAPRAAYQGLRTATYKYVEYGTGERELYDLVTDPYELKNLAAGADPQLLAALQSWLASYGSCAGAGCRSADAITAPSLPVTIALPMVRQ